MPCCFSVAISPASSARIVAPIALPSISFAPACTAADGLAGNAHRPRLPNHDYPDLPRILKLAIDLARDLVGEPHRRGIVDRLRGHHDAHLPARLDRKHLLHALELRRQRFELGQPLHVRLERLTPRAGPRAGDGIRRLHDHADGRLVGDVVVMGRDAIDHDRVLAVLGGHFDAELYVRAVVLVRQHLADVMQQRAALRERDVELQLGGHDAGEVGDFLGMLENVLPVGGPVLHPAHELYQLGVHAANPDVVDRLLARFHDAGVDVRLRFFDDLLDAARMDAAVGDQALEGEAADLAPDRLEAGHDHGVGRVVDDDVDAGGRFERADVAPLAPDDPALHFVRRQQHRRHARLGRLLGGDPLNREGDDLLRFAVGVLPGLLRDVADQRPGLVARLVFDPLDQLEFGFLRRQAGDLLEPRADRLLALAEVARALLQLLVELVEILLAAVHAGELLVEAFVEVLADRHELFLGGQHEALTLVHRATLDASPPYVEGQCRDEHAAEHGRNDTGQLRHLSISSRPAQLALNAFRFAGGSIFARSSATAARRAATSRSVCFARNSSFVMSSAARIAALCVSTNGP